MNTILFDVILLLAYKKNDISNVINNPGCAVSCYNHMMSSSLRVCFVLQIMFPRIHLVKYVFVDVFSSM